MKRERPVDPGEVLHLLHGDAPVPGGRHYIVVRDSLNLGPSDVDPVLHARKRREFWKEFDGCLLPPEHLSDRLERLDNEIFGVHELDSALRNESDERPVFIWTTRTWPDRLFLW